MYEDPICGCGETRDGMQARGGEGRRGEARGGHETRQNEAAAIERGWRGRGRRSSTSYAPKPGHTTDLVNSSRTRRSSTS